MLFASWNLMGFAERGQAAYLADQAWDVCAIQEATTAKALDRLGAIASATSWVSARPLLREATETRPKYATALLARLPWVVGHAGVLEAPSPERALYALATCADLRITVASMALPPAVSWGVRPKVEQAATIATWLGSVSGPVLVGIDANTPKVDHPDLDRSVWWNQGEERLLGSERTHRLRDVYREIVDRETLLRASIVAARPDGPLAVSYRRGRRAPIECRYDSILASPHIAVIAAGYDYDGACAAGSDHAFAWAEIDVRA